MSKFNINRFNNSNNPVQPGNNDYAVNAENTELFGELMNRFLSESKAPESEQAIPLAFIQSFLDQHNIPSETTHAIIANIKTLNTDTLNNHDTSFMQAAVDLVRYINTLPDTVLDSFSFELHAQLERKNKQKGQTLL
ncbi:hypothetical protein N9L24_04360 [Candidatus Marinamargulisbacteria bacterium]|jgi:hypothetical protein|nr:hypothetical protein [Candidatus Marinamargulisbacteria bacterium]